MQRYTTFFVRGVLTLSAAGLLAGCSNGGPFSRGDNTKDDLPSKIDRDTRVPREAQVVAEGTETLRYRATDSGRVYLFNASNDRVIDMRSIAEGREYVVSAGDGKAWIDKQRVLNHDFDDGDRLRIYFVRNDAGSSFDGRTGDGVVPKSASIVREGRGDLSYEADRNGTIYVYDAESETVILSTRLQDGQRFTVSPQGQRASVDGTPVTIRKSFKEDQSYRLYFDRNDATARVNE